MVGAGLTIAAGVLLPFAYLLPEIQDIQRRAYFNVDDFDNIYWTYRLSAGEMLGYILDPTFSFFRPVGMVPYWLLGRLFNLDAGAFHATQTGLNLVNAGLVCALVLTLTRSRLAAVLAAFLWITAAALLEAMWWFASVHYMLATTWFIVGLLAYIRLRPWPTRSLAVTAAYLLAIKTQETAVTLPLVLGTCELLVQGSRQRDRKSRVLLCGFLACIGAVVASAKTRSMVASDQATGYTFDFSPGTLAHNATWYVEQLFPWLGTDTGHVWWAVAGIGVIGLVLRDRLMLFGLAFAAITLLPVIFLREHLFAFYWYLSAIGIWLCVARLGQRASAVIRRRCGVSWRQSAEFVVAAALMIAALAYVAVQAGDYRAPRVEWTRARAAMFRDYIGSIVGQPDPPPDAVIEAADAPAALDDEALTTLYRLLYDRRDITVTASTRRGQT